MSNIYVLDDNKKVCPRQTKPHRKNEHNVEKVQILVPEFYNKQDMKKCIVMVEFRRTIEGKKILTKEIHFNKELYKEHLVYEFPVSRELTSQVGQVYFSLSFTSSNFYMKSGFDSYIEVIE